MSHGFSYFSSSDSTWQSYGSFTANWLAANESCDQSCDQSKQNCSSCDGKGWCTGKPDSLRPVPGKEGENKHNVLPKWE